MIPSSIDNIQAAMGHLKEEASLLNQSVQMIVGLFVKAQTQKQYPEINSSGFPLSDPEKLPVVAAGTPTAPLVVPNSPRC